MFNKITNIFHKLVAPAQIKSSNKDFNDIAHENSLFVSNKDILVKLRKEVSMEDDLYHKRITMLLESFADYVGDISASQTYYKDRGGVFEHGLKSLFYAQRLSSAKMYSIGLVAEVKREEEPVWIYCSMIGALYSSLSYMVNNGEVSANNICWSPYIESLTSFKSKQGEAYDMQWRDLDCELFNPNLLVLCFKIIPDNSMNYIAKYPKIFKTLINVLAGSIEPEIEIAHNTLKSVIRDSVEHSINQSLSKSTRYDETVNISTMLKDALRQLSKTKWMVNGPGNALYKSKLKKYILWEKAATDIKHLLQSQKIYGIPQNVDSLKEVYIENGILKGDENSDYIKIKPQIDDCPDITLNTLEIIDEECFQSIFVQAEDIEIKQINSTVETKTTQKEDQNKEENTEIVENQCIPENEESENPEPKPKPKSKSKKVPNNKTSSIKDYFKIIREKNNRIADLLSYIINDIKKGEWKKEVRYDGDTVIIEMMPVISEYGYTQDVIKTCIELNIIERVNENNQSIFTKEASFHINNHIKSDQENNKKAVKEVLDKEEYIDQTTQSKPIEKIDEKNKPEIINKPEPVKTQKTPSIAKGKPDDWDITQTPVNKAKKLIEKETKKLISILETDIENDQYKATLLTLNKESIVFIKEDIVQWMNKKELDIKQLNNLYQSNAIIPIKQIPPSLNKYKKEELLEIKKSHIKNAYSHYFPD